jgi:hypothetical protein
MSRSVKFLTPGIHGASEIKEGDGEKQFWPHAVFTVRELMLSVRMRTIAGNWGRGAEY